MEEIEKDEDFETSYKYLLKFEQKLINRMITQGIENLKLQPSRNGINKKYTLNKSWNQQVKEDLQKSKETKEKEKTRNEVEKKRETYAILIQEPKEDIRTGFVKVQLGNCDIHITLDAFISFLFLLTSSFLT